MPKEGIQRVDRNVEVVVRPLADGGEGSVEALVEGCQGKLETITVSGPLGKSVKASYGYFQKVILLLLKWLVLLVLH